MSRNMKTVRIMVFMALYSALTIVLDYARESIPFTSVWANGGSIDISLIALVIITYIPAISMVFVSLLS